MTPETAPAWPKYPYALTKYVGEQYVLHWEQTYHLPAVSCRFFNVYGPRQDPSSPYSGVISIFTDRARAGRPLTIFGDGMQTRDFVYVGDVVRAIASALAVDAPFVLANVGTGNEITVLELARTIVESVTPEHSIALVHRTPVAQMANQYIGMLAETRMLLVRNFRDVEQAKDLNAVRNRLLDLVGAAKGLVGPDARARMTGPPR